MSLADEEARARLRHDLHARLAVIVGYADLLRTRDDELLRRQGLDHILEAAQVLGRDIEALFAPPEELPEPRGSGTVVVIVDDDARVRELLKLTLPEAEYVVREAADGSRAVQLVESEDPSLVVLDWHLPGRLGAEVLEDVRRRRPRLPIIVLTSERREAERAELLGASAFLSKPFSPVELLETIERLLAERPRDEAA